MHSGKQFVKNAFLLSFVNIILRGISVSFNAYVNNKIGSESMGLFTLVMSIYGFVLTLALSCVNLGAVRITSEKSALLSGADSRSWKFSMRGVIRSTCTYSMIFSVTTAVLLFLFAEPVAVYLLKDTRTIKSLKILSVSLPAISLSSAISGYFTGLRKVSKNAVTAISEQFVKIIVTSTALVMISPGNVETACMAVVGGAAFGEAWSLILNLIMYFTDSGRPAGERLGSAKIRLTTKLKEVSDISLPSAVGAYARQGLTTLEHIAIPEGLKKSGLSVSEALSSYGLLQGIAFPLVMFPYAVIGSFTSLLIPEIAEQKELGKYSEIKNLTEKVYKYSAYFSIFACGIFVNYAGELGQMVYNSEEAIIYTVLLGLLVPFMYLDTAVDSILKGIGEQVYVMKINILDAAAGLILVLILTPAMGIYGYILTVWICEVGNLLASIHKIGKKTGSGLGCAIKYYINPAIVLLCLTVLKQLALVKLTPVYSIIIFSAIYILLIFGQKKRPAKASLQ